ncbi:hypothetical protein BFS79_07190 [Cutibacterium avidum]|nr:hypothetical protein BFS79_07190 [Cutibacterium avidum]
MYIVLPSGQSGLHLFLHPDCHDDGRYLRFRDITNESKMPSSREPMAHDHIPWTARDSAL